MLCYINMCISMLVNVFEYEDAVKMCMYICHCVYIYVYSQELVECYIEGIFVMRMVCAVKCDT